MLGLRTYHPAEGLQYAFNLNGQAAKLDKKRHPSSIVSFSLQLRLILDRVGEAGVKSAWFDPEACTQDVLEAYKKVNKPLLLS